jgi:hypothetical protein
MTVSPNKIKPNYWEKLEIGSADLQFLTNYLFETEEPLPIHKLSQVLLRHRLEILASEEASQIAKA